jgi:hypothetical protein
MEGTAGSSDSSPRAAVSLANGMDFDHNSAPSCRDLIQILDEQNPRILDQLTALKALIDTFKAIIADMQGWDRLG